MANKFDRTIVHPVRTRRFNKGWSSRERLAVEAHLSKSTIDTVEQGKWVSDQSLARIATALGTTYEELVGEIDTWKVALSAELIRLSSLSVPKCQS